MRGLHAWCVLGGLVASACIDVPPHQGAPIDAPVDATEIDAPPCGSNALDCDDDGWVADAINPGAHDCNDFNPTIHPGALDDDEPGMQVNDDCIADGVGDRLIGVTGDEAGWASGVLSINFGSPTRMPSNLRISGVDVLGRDVNCTTNNEEGMGVSLYPAFAAHVRAQLTPEGNHTVERRGPAMATTLVAWTYDIPAAGPEHCNVMTTIAGNIRFTMLPGQRLIRDDSLTVATGVATCEACGSGVTPPILSSYLALIPSYGDISIDGVTGNVQNTTLAAGPREVCLWQNGGPGHLAMTWDGTGAGVRTRRTGANNAAVVFDWFRSTAVPSGNRRLSTSFVAHSAMVDNCDEPLQAIHEIAAPPIIQGMTYNSALGAYEPAPAQAGGVVTFQALAAVARGVAVRAPAGFDTRGFTVWRRPSGSMTFTRLIGAWQYVSQHEGTEAVVWMPALAPGDRIIIAGPGHEPEP